MTTHVTRFNIEYLDKQIYLHRGERFSCNLAVKFTKHYGSKLDIIIKAYTLLHVGSWRGMNIHISQTMCLRLFKTLSWDINNPKHYSVLYGPWTNMGWYDSNCNIGSRRHLGAIKIILASSRLRHVVFHVISQIRNLTWLRIKRLRRLK